MKTEDLRTLTQIGNALWIDRDLSRRRTVETIEAVSLLSIPEERVLERASSVLLARANREDPRINAALLGDPFFRLLPEERLILVGLHFERWSYERLARILGCTEEQVATRAWKIRVHLASQPNSTQRPAGRNRLPAVLGAVGVAPKKPTCPEFHALNPWTQRFLDEEYASRERVFLQNHLMACDDCRMALSRCRELYFHVEKMIPRSEASGDERELQGIARMAIELRKRRNPMLWTWKDAVLAFVRRAEVQLMIAFLLAMFCWQLLS